MEPPGVGLGPDDESEAFQEVQTSLDGANTGLEGFREGLKACTGLAARVVVSEGPQEAQEGDQGGAIVQAVAVQVGGDLNPLKDVPRPEGAWSGTFDPSGVPQLSHVLVPLSVLVWDGSPGGLQTSGGSFFCQS